MSFDDGPDVKKNTTPAQMAATMAHPKAMRRQ
jgi:hypothetical protein